jgi:hypothetical protein
VFGAGGGSRCDSTVRSTSEFAAFQREADFMCERVAFFFGEPEPARKFKFVGWGVICLAQMGEQAVAKSHKKSACGERAVLSLLA